MAGMDLNPYESSKDVHATQAIGGEEPLPERPLWVRFGLWGLPNRASAWAFFWLALGLAIGCVAYGFVDPRFFIGGGFILSAWWYYAAIRWVDRNGRWNGASQAT